MKLKKIEQILKQNKTIILYHGPDDIQFLSDGAALYPMFNLPELTKESIFTMFDIPEEKASKFLFEIRALSQTLDVNVKDIDPTENLLERSKISICLNGIKLEPLKTSQGIRYINTRYLEPFADIETGYEIYERTRTDGMLYFAIKSGLILRGIVLPSFGDEKFIKEPLKEILQYTADEE